MEAQRGRARAASKFGADLRELDQAIGQDGFLRIRSLGPTRPRHGADFRGGAWSRRCGRGQEGQVVLDHTPFYAESGGQIGRYRIAHRAAGRASREGHAKNRRLVRAHRRARGGRTARRRPVEARVDGERARQAIVLNHSATHLLHAALREVLGKHVQQKGSLGGAGSTCASISRTLRRVTAG